MPVLRILGDEARDRVVVIRSRMHDTCVAVGAHPPQLRPVVEVLVGKKAHRRMGGNVVEATQRVRPLGLRVHRCEDRVALDGEAHRHEMRTRAGVHGGEPCDARAREACADPVLVHGADDTVVAVTRAALLLTGGSSRRMGAPKAEITWRGERLADRAARVLTAVCDPVMEVGPGYTALPAAVEEPPGGGPLAALVAGHHELVRRGARDGPIVVLAVDLPFVGPELVRLLADWPGDGTVVPTADGHLQVLCARYGIGVVGTAAGLLAEGRRSLVGLIDRVPAEIVGETRWRAVAGANAHSFADVDTPDDVARWLADVDG